MKKHIENHLADIIFRLPQKPFYIWILLIIIQAFQLIQTGVCLISRLHPTNSIYFTLKRIIGIFTFRPIQQQFPIFCFFLQTIYIIFLILIVIKFITGKPQVGSILNYCEVWCPVLITISIESLAKYHHLVPQILSFFTAITSMFLWGLRLMVLCQDYVSRNAKFSSVKSTIRMLVFCFQSIILYFELSSTLVIIFISVSSGLLFIAFVLSLTIIENIDEELEYLHHLKCACATCFYISIIVVQFLNQHGYLLIVSLLIAFGCERIGIWKFLFEIKYTILLNRVSKYQGDEDLIILLSIVGGAHTLKPNGIENLKGRFQSYWTTKQIQFNFHLKAKQVCMNLAVKRSKQLGEELQIQTIIKQQTFSVIQDYMMKKIKSKSKLLPFVMIGQCIKRELLIKALTIHSSIIGEMDFNQRILKKVLKLRISHFSNSKDKMGSIYQLSFGLCCLNKIILISRIDQVIEHQTFYQKFLKHLIQLSLITSRLFTKLTTKIIETNKIMTILEEQFIIKSKLNHSLNQNIIISKEIISLFYIYFAHFCSQKFSIFNTLSGSFIALEQISIKISKQFMICLVSGTHNNRGAIINANHEMIEFFNLDFEHIKQNLSHIEDILPRPLAIIHNNLISKCLQTGLSTIIGSISRFYIVKNNTSYPVEFQVKFQPFIDGINFSCEIRLINSDCFILFDKQNEIVGFSEIARYVLPKKKQESKYLSEIFGNVRKTQTKLPGASQESLFSKTDPFSTNKYLQEQKKYQTNIEFYKTQDFELGICKFIKNGIESSKNVTSESQVFLQIIEQSNKSEVKTKQGNNQFMILENKISSMEKNIPIISNFKWIIMSYGVVLGIMTVVFFVLINRSIQENQVICEYQNTLFHNSPEENLLAIDRIYNLNRAMYNGLYPSTSIIHKNVTVKEFLATQYTKQLTDLSHLKYSLFQQTQNLPQSLVALITGKTLEQPTLSGFTLSLPLHSFISYILDRKTAISHYTPSQWMLWNTTHPHTVLMNSTLLELENKIFSTLFSELGSERSYIKLIVTGLLIATEALAGIGIIFSIVILNRIIQEKKKYMCLLAETDNKLLNSKLKVNQELTSVLNTIVKSSLNNLIVSQNTETVEFTYGANKSRFNKNTLEISDGDKGGDNAQKYRSNMRKSLDNKNYQYQQYLALAIIIFIILPILGSLLLGYFNNFVTTVNSAEYYQEFIKINNKISKCAGVLLNVNTMYIAGSSSRIFDMTRDELFEKSYSCIINREIEEKLKDFVPYLTTDKSVETSIEDYLYLSKCSEGNTRCEQVLSGSITRGIPSALLSYTTLATSLYNRMLNFTGAITGFKLRISLESLQAFTYYIRQILQMSDFVLLKVKNIFAKNKEHVLFLLELTIVLEIGLNLVFLVFIFKSRRQIYELKKEVFTILPVDVLIENINFNFEIRNLS